MATGELMVDAFIWHEATHKSKIGPGSTRLAKGTTIEILPQETAIVNNSKVKLVGDAKFSGLHGVLRSGTEGHISTGKIRVDGDDMLERLNVQKPSINGLGQAVFRGWEAEDSYAADLNNMLQACDALDDLIRLYVTKESSAKKWKMAAQGFSGLQVATGVTALGIAIALTVVTAGAAAPLMVAFGVSTTVAAVSGGVAGFSTGTLKKSMAQTTHRATVASKDTLVTIGAPLAKQEIITTVAATSGKAAAITTGHVLGITAGVLPAAMGSKNLYDLSNVDPEKVWSWVDWPPILESMEIHLDKLIKEKPCAPNLAQQFNHVIERLGTTLKSIQRANNKA